MRQRLILAIVLTFAAMLPLESPLLAGHFAPVPVPGTILAPVSRQAAGLNLEAPRPRLLTSLGRPVLISESHRSRAAPCGRTPPDGRQLFVYSGSGSAIIDIGSGEIASYDYLAGYGATAWLP